MKQRTYTVLIIGILYHSRYWQRILAHTVKRIMHFIEEVVNTLLVILRLIRADYYTSIAPKVKDIYYYVLLKLASGYIKLKQTRIRLKLEYQKLDKVSILMKAQKIIMVVSIVLFAGALGLLGYRGMELVRQLRSEIEIEKMYLETQPVKVDTDNITLSTVIDPQTEPTVNYPTTLPQFDKLLTTNEDTIGWLKIDNTRIDHVVMQGKDNIFYLEHDYFGNKSISASMMLDSQCDIENMKYHYVVYGHRMKSGTMMNDILKYEDEGFFYSNPIITFNTIYESLEWEVFSTYLNSYDYDNNRIVFFDDNEWLEYIQRLQNDSIYTTDIILNKDDVVLTLYTCDYRIAGGRYVVHARLVQS